MRRGRLVYADNLVSGTQIQTLITLRGWIPLRLCSTSFGDLDLVIMYSDDGEQTTIFARYFGST